MIDHQRLEGCRKLRIFQQAGDNEVSEKLLIQKTPNSTGAEDLCVLQIVNGLYEASFGVISNSNTSL